MVVWVGGLEGRGNCVFFFVFLFAGCVGNCDFLFAKLGMDVCKQTFLLVQPLLSKRRSAGVGRRNCPCTETPAGCPTWSVRLAGPAR